MPEEILAKHTATSLIRHCNLHELYSLFHMNAAARYSRLMRLRLLVIGLVTFRLSATFCQALSYQLASNNASWPADKRAAIVAAMDAAVALYNANGYFAKNLTANYNSGVPTAQGSYSGWIDFGGSINTRVALHEISHTLGIGTYTAWNSKRNTSTNRWTGTRALARLSIFDGAGAVLNADTAHFWPYGLNYDTEDSTTNRVRHIKMVAAMRWDMGIVTDSDNDGMPDDWEQFYFNGLSQTATGDWDADGTNNLAEYNADTHPGTAFAFTWKGGTGDWDLSTLNWSGAATRWRNGGNDAATFAGTSGTVTVADGVSTNDMTFNASGYTITGAGLALTGSSPTFTAASSVAVVIESLLSGTSGLTKNGAGTVTLKAANAFSGPLTINAGTLAIAPGGRLYMNSGAGQTTIQGGGVLSFTGNWGWDGTLRYMGVQASENIIDGGTLQHTGPSNDKTSAGAGRLFTIGAAGATLDSATAGAEFTLGYRYDYGRALASEGGTLTLSGAGDGELNYDLPGAGALVKRGTGTWKLTGTANSFSGGTTIGVSTNQGTVGGTLVINDSTSLGSGAITVLAGDTTGTHMGAQLQLTGGITLNNPTIAISGLGFGSNNGILRNVSGNNSINGVIQLTSGAGGSIIASDAGKLTIGAGGITATFTARTLELTGAGNIDVSGVISNGSTAALPLTKSGSGTLVLTGNNTYSGTTTINAGTLQVGANTSNGKLGSGAVINNGILRFNRSDTALIVPNAISGTGSLELGQASGGTATAITTLTGANSFTGAITVNSGGLRVTRSDSLGAGPKTVTMTNGTNGVCRLILDGSAGNISLPTGINYITSNASTTDPAIINEAGNNTIAGNFSLMSGGGSTRVRVDSGSLTLSGQFSPAVSGRTLQLDGSATGFFTGALKNASNAVGLEKWGSGTWTLAGSGHTYTGATTINAGRLIVSSLLSSPISVSNGTFAPQGSPQSSGGLTMAAGGRYEIRINGTQAGAQYDQFTTSGAVSLNGTLDLSAVAKLNPGSSFTILNKTSSGAISGVFNGLPEGSAFTQSGYMWIISYTAGDGNDVAVRLATAQEQWRLAFFGTSANAGSAANNADADGDGETNLLEFATDQHPFASTQLTSSMVKNGNSLQFRYRRATTASSAGLNFIVEWSNSLSPNSWSSAGLTTQIISDNGTQQLIQASMPTPASNKHFFRLRVTD